MAGPRRAVPAARGPAAALALALITPLAAAAAVSARRQAVERQLAVAGLRAAARFAAPALPAAAAA
jgi:hypothetical protein